MAKRNNGMGTLRKRKDGRWEGRFNAGVDENGKKQVKYILAKTKTECNEKLKKAIKEYEEAQLILYSSSYLFTESANQYTMDNNLTLFTNAISTMAGESESISIPTKSMASTYATVPTASAVRYGILLMGILPIGLLAAGIIIWARRRKR